MQIAKKCSFSSAFSLRKIGMGATLLGTDGPEFAKYYESCNRKCFFKYALLVSSPVPMKTMHVQRFRAKKCSLKIPFSIIFVCLRKKILHAAASQLYAKIRLGTQDKEKKRFSPNPWNKLPEDIMKRRFTLQRKKQGGSESREKHYKKAQ